MSDNDQRFPVYRSRNAAAGAKDLSTIREREVYVIIGRGFAAVANHLTLRASTNPEVRARVDRCRMVIVGGDEPWKARGATPLGQFPHMLGLPAYQPLSGGRSYALANEFGKYISDAEESLARHGDQKVRLPDQDFRLPDNAWIGLIETFDQYKNSKVPDDEQNRRDDATRVGPKPEEWDQHPGFPYRLSVFWREPKAEKPSVYYLYAHYVDVCTGPGPARLLDKSVYSKRIESKEAKKPEEKQGEGDGAVADRNEEEQEKTSEKSGSTISVKKDDVKWEDDEALYQEHAGRPDDQPDYGKLKKLAKGDQHIGAKLPAPRPGIDVKKGEAEVLIYGASASGAWSAEHVLDTDERLNLHWCADPKRSPVKEPGRDYATQLRDYFMHPAQANAPGGRNLSILKRTEHCRFLAKIERLESLDNGRIKVTFAIPEGAPGHWAATEREYDQVVITIGQDNSKERAGSAAYLVQFLGKMTPIYAKDLWNDLQNDDKTIPVGLTDGRGHLRILGVASVAVLTKGSDPFKDFNTYYTEHAKSLPQEGRAGGNSLLMATATVELANRFMPARLDANHACPSLIQRLVGTADVAAQVIKARKEENFRQQPTPDSDRYFGKGILTRDELKSVITNDDTLNKFTQQA